MLLIALVLALIGLVALVFAVVTSNELVAWVCIAASVLGVVLLIIDAVRERQRREAGEEQSEDQAGGGEDEEGYVDYPQEIADDSEQDEGDGDTAVEAAEADVTEESAVAAERGDDATP
ncbi:hypothetical protein [Mycobacterium lacus]|uniref:Uncharacterized protein n=1 Tax=Mycobacterium lacus TaxID=169765 RepID=A0A1X1XYE3_9MYCO|nr:hypothetical protein [Mycobacterium lacus]MCV7125203.1 hypothetical protein [Mycobacterium lacus]ORW03839.1 hypothetical protein AWC15_04860 [Mycobacterium lacus]BBX96856.1 hypothetical protein MLAC_21500 [Mycobacterium lacus]